MQGREPGTNRVNYRGGLVMTASGPVVRRSELQCGHKYFDTEVTEKDEATKITVRTGATLERFAKRNSLCDPCWLYHFL
jgi:hypothetical protein